MHNGRMVLDGIDVFVKVVQAGGFSAAARQLGMPTTTVSAKIARLEERLGVTLIRRSTRKMQVTAAGEAYFTHCAEALRALEMGEGQLAAEGSAPRGTLRITAPPDIASAILPPIVDRYLALYPEVSAELVVTNVPLDLLAERIDLAVRASPMKDSSLQSRKIGAARLHLFASRSYLDMHGTPRRPEDLARHRVMIHTRVPSNYWELSSSSRSFRLTPTSRIKADDMQTLGALAAQGTGIALLPDFGATPHDLVKVLPAFGTPGGNAYFVFPAGRFTPVNVRAFLDLAIEMT